MHFTLTNAHRSLRRHAVQGVGGWRAALFALAGGLLLTAVSAPAQTLLYWDTNGATAGAGASPSGTWSTVASAKTWNTSSAGTNNAVKWTSNDIAVFSAGTDATGSYTVTVVKAPSVAGIIVEEGTPTFTGGTVSLTGTAPQIDVAAGSNLLFGSAFAGPSVVEKVGAGTLTFTSNLNYSGELRLTGGTLALSGITATIGTLHITGNTVLDFGNSAASTLNATTLLIDAGVTLTVANWAYASDYFYAQNWTGATYDATASTPMNQVTFSPWSNNITAWRSFDNQVLPVPEPSAYGAAFVGLALAWTAWRRRRVVALSC